MKPTIKLLLIDDDPGDRQLIKELLSKVRRTTYQIDEVSNITDARLNLAVDRHDAYLVDYFLGEASGLELIREGVKTGCQAPMVVITGADSDEVDTEVIEAGAADYLPKDELSPSLLDRIIRHSIERKKANDKLEQLAKEDSLTRLANRAMFEESLDRAVSLSQRRGSSFAVMLLDLDRFKEINDTLGHNVGDMLLVLIAERLKKVTRAEDVIARLGGDEFALLLEGITTQDVAGSIARKILDALSKPTPIDGKNLNISTSIGIAMCPENGRSPITLMQNADMALYLAKDKGRNNYQFFTDELQQRLHHELTLEQELRVAIKKEQFCLHYQPQVSLSEGHVIGFEALVRWNHPDKGLLSPDAFIPIAEKTGLIVEIGDWVLRAACAQLKVWRDMGFQDLQMAINISPKQLRGKHFFDEIIEVMEQNRLDIDSIELELTEAMFTDTSERNLSFFRKIRDQGIRIAIDDFGTGYSSLGYLKHFPVDRLKIDRSFVSGDNTGLEERNITQSIITLGHGLGMKVIAEGIETLEQAELLKNQSCDEGQGYYFSKPLSVPDAVQFLEKSIGFQPPTAGER